MGKAWSGGEKTGLVAVIALLKTDCPSRLIIHPAFLDAGDRDMAADPAISRRPDRITMAFLGSTASHQNANHLTLAAENLTHNVLREDQNSSREHCWQHVDGPQKHTSPE